MTPIAGHADQGFGPVVDAFERNFQDGREDAAALTVYASSRPVVDIWAGADGQFNRPMRADSLMRVASCSKGITAAIVGSLVDTGAIDPEMPVHHYWPEYVENGKSETTVEMVMSHRAGLPFAPAESGLTQADYLAGSRVVEALQAAAPLWRPGTAMAYHSVTYGILINEIVRRATRRTIGAHLREFAEGPLALRAWMGLPAELDSSLVPGLLVAPKGTEPPAPNPGSFDAIRRDALRESPPLEPNYNDLADVRATLAAEMPAIGAVTDARSLARMYAATIDEVDGVRLFSETTLKRMTQPQTDGIPVLGKEPGTTGPHLRFGLGFMLPSSTMSGLGPSSFGHTGAGGRLGLADTEFGVSIGYLCSRMQPIPPGGDPRWKGIITAIKGCL